MRKSSPLLLAGLIGIATTALFFATAAQEQQGPRKAKVVFIAGKPSHGPGQHEHRAGSMLLADHLTKSGAGFETTVVTNGWPEDESILDGADAIVIYADGGGRHPAIKHLAKLRGLAEKGTGIGCIHYAVEIPEGEPGNTFLDTIGGVFETNWSVNPHWKPTFEMPDHVVANGVNEFSLQDEWYYHMRFRKDMEGVTPILSALPPEETLSRKNGPHSGNPHVRKAVLEDKKPQHVMWVFERPETLGGGRAFGFTGGHFHKNWQNDDQRRIVLNAIAWISGVAIPQKGITTSTPTEEEMRANLDEK